MEVDVAVDLLLPPLATSAGVARRLLRDAWAETESEESYDAAQLALSEIVTNALVHAGTQMRLRILLVGEGLRVELTDGSPHLPHRRDYAANAATGRGLHMVAELVDRWGAYPSEKGKVVWFEFAPMEAATEADALGQIPAEGAPAEVVAVQVEMLEMPLLMHAAWQEHAAALLRELLLVRLDEDLGALEGHAAASDALSLLFEQVPSPDVGQDPEAIMATATEPGVSVARLLLEVPEPSVTHFQVLDEMLEDAVTLAERGELLAPRAPPEIRAMRHWICQQVRNQDRGGAALAWASPVDPTQSPSSSAAPIWDPGTVAASSRALVAADDANRILAVSPSALAMLGYDDASRLVGHRLISLIPPRYHQAHIAGFTLHLINGRNPLLGRRVTVPVLRSDGSEATLDLLVEAQPLPDGRRLFTAELFG